VVWAKLNKVESSANAKIKKNERIRSIGILTPSIALVELENYAIKEATHIIHHATRKNPPRDVQAR
jgi:hypothetical protein